MSIRMRVILMLGLLATSVTCSGCGPLIVSGTEYIEWRGTKSLTRWAIRQTEERHINNAARVLFMRLRGSDASNEERTAAAGGLLAIQDKLISGWEGLKRLEPGDPGSRPIIKVRGFSFEHNMLAKNYNTYASFAASHRIDMQQRKWFRCLFLAGRPPQEEVALYDIWLSKGVEFGILNADGQPLPSELGECDDWQKE